MSAEIFPLKLKEGVGSCLVADICAIIPDAAAPKTRSVLFSGMFNQGITVELASDVLTAMWGIAIDELQASYNKEPGEGEYCDMCGSKPCDCEPEEEETDELFNGASDPDADSLD